MAKNHFILVGRTSAAIAQAIVAKYGPANQHHTEDSPLLLSEPSNVIQTQMGTFEGGESVFRLFLSNGAQEDHQIQQRLSEADKRKIEKKLPGAHITIVHSISGENTSSRAMSLLHAAYDLKNKYKVANITLIAPHLPYMRNDREFEKETEDGLVKERNAVSCNIYAMQLKAMGIDSVVGMEPHSRDGVEAYHAHFGKNASFINTGKFFSRDFAQNNILSIGGEWQIAVGSPDGLNKPDDYGIARAKSFGIKLYKNTPLFNHFTQSHKLKKISYMYGIHKERLNEKETVIRDFQGNVEGKHAVIIDDIISSGGTTLHAAEALKERGAAKVTAIATHAVLTQNGLQKLLNSDFIDAVYLTDTIPGSFERADRQADLANPKLTVKTVAPLVLAQIKRDHKKSHSRWAYHCPDKEQWQSVIQQILMPRNG